MLNNRRMKILFTPGEKEYIQHETSKYKTDIVFKFLNIRLLNIILLLTLMLALDIFNVFYSGAYSLLYYYTLSATVIGYIFVIFCIIIKLNNYKTEYSLYIIKITSIIPILIFTVQIYTNIIPYIKYLL